MKKGKWIATGIALLLTAVLLAFPVMAEDDDQELTNQNTSGQTEVDAEIKDGSGEVAYIVTVPVKIDFGTLVCPDTDVDSYKIIPYDVTCVQMLGVKNVKVSVCNLGAKEGETNQIFYLTNDDNWTSSFKPTYDVYVNRENKIDTSKAMPKNGFDYAVFTAEGEFVNSGVALNQRQLFPYKDNLKSIAGNYIGNLVFTTVANVGVTN